MKRALLVAAMVALCGCSTMQIPRLAADEVHCEYHRVDGTINWHCDVSGAGQSMPVDIF